MTWTWLPSLSEQLKLACTENASWGQERNTLVEPMLNTINPWV